MSKHKSLSYQIKQRLTQLTRYGDSKHVAKKSEGPHPKGIFSMKTYDNYVQKCLLFAEWVKSTYGARDLKDLPQYMNEYIEYRKTVTKGNGELLSAWTVKLDRAAIEKLFEPEGYKISVDLPKRKRQDITKNRTEIKDFSETKHNVLVRFGKSCGVRREELLDLKYINIDVENGTVLIEQGKGGKMRTINVLDRSILEEITRGDHDPWDSVFDRVPVRYPEHRYRRYYAQTLYKQLARPIEEIPRHERYYCRGDYKGVIYDKIAMMEVSKQLGHARTSVIASHYLNKTD